MRVSITEDDIKQVISGYQQVAETYSDYASYRDIREELAEEGDMPSRGNVVEKCNSLMEKGEIELVSGDTEGKKKRFAVTGSQKVMPEVQREIEEARELLEKRILRQPTIDEVAEELRKEPTEEFRVIFRNSVDEKWRSPDEGKIDEKKAEVQKRVGEAIMLHMWGEQEEEKVKSSIDDGSVEYYENNKELFEEFDIEATDYLWDTDVPTEFKAEAPPKLAKFMEDPVIKFSIPHQFERDDEKGKEFYLRITEKFREEQSN